MPKLTKTQRGRQASFGFLLNLLHRRADSKMKQKLENIGVDIKLFVNLRMLNENEGISQRELGRILEFPEYHTSRNVDALVEANMAERRPDPESRRSVKLYLTEEGRAKASKLPSIISDVNSSLLKDLSPEEKATLISLLQKVAKIPIEGDTKL